MEKHISPGSDLVHSTAIVCKDLPIEYSDRTRLRAHFAQFGNVTKVFTNPEKRQASVHFDTRLSAANALKYGKDGTSMKIFWKRPTRKSSEGPTDVKARTSQGSESTDESNASGASSPGNALSPTATAKPPSVPAVLFGKKVVSDMPLSPPQSSTTSPKKVAAANSAAPEGLADAGGLFGRSIRGLQSSAAAAAAAASATSSASESSLPGSASRWRESSPSPDAQARAEDKLQFSQLKSASATTAEERYRVLDVWDKHVKQGLQKQSDISTARATRGTCPDMCPEKERYMREFQRRVHIYESLPGTELNPCMDHSRAVKEYSRSSADQEEPLPSDLRPAAVLERTMDYLVACVVDPGGSLSSWGDWYDFLWDRTRGIRKDITQQHLCDEVAVSLVEKCARFHVFCAERLCEEAVQAFDRKINDENLTKCLQTLREMYHDLRKVRAAPCPNEAEFRGYMVLMKLNEGDTLREVQQLEPDLRKSPEIQFVLSVYASLESYNYTRFFKLLKSGTFLNACLMHRYFNQIRLKAVDIMMKAYKDRSSKFPLDEFVRILNFENDAEAIDFCHYYGLTSSAVDSTIVLQRQSDYVVPETPLKARRAILLVERKMTTSIGQVINGGWLPEVVLSAPVSSFDSDNRFIRTSHDGARPDTSEARSPAAHSVEPNAALASDEVQRAITADLCLAVIADLARAVAAETLREARSWVDAVAPPLATALLDEVVIASLRTAVQEVCSEQRTEQAMVRRQAEAARSLSVVAGSMVDELLAQVTASEARTVAEEVYRFAAAEQQRRAHALDDCAAAVARELVDAEACDFAERVARDFHRTHVAERLAELERCLRRFELRRQRLQLDQWRRALASRRRLRSFLMEFPPGPSLRPLAAATIAPACRAPAQPSSRGMVASATADPDGAVRQRLKLDASVLAKRLKLAHAASPLNVAQIVAPFLAVRAEAADLSERRSRKVASAASRLLGNLLCFKLLVLLPERDSTLDGASSSYGDRWPELIAEKLSYGPTPTEPSSTSAEVAPLLSLYSVTHGRWQACACVRTAGAELNEVSTPALAASGICRGTTALLCVLPTTTVDGKDTVSMQHRKWLDHCHSSIRLALSTKPTTPAIPLLLLVPRLGAGDSGAAALSSEGQIAHALQLDELLEHGAVSAVRVSFVDVALSGQSLVDTLTEGLQWLAARAPPEPRIRCRDTATFVDSVLAREFYAPMYEDLAARQEIGLPHQDPGCLLSLYNDVVERLASSSALDAIADVSWPPLELCPAAQELPFYGGLDAACSRVATAEHLRRLALPAFGWPPAASGSGADAESDWSAVCQRVSAYAWLVCNGDEVDSVALFSSIRQFLKKAMLPAAATAAGGLAFRKNGHGNSRSRPSSAGDCVPWTDVVVACVEQRLTTRLGSCANVWYLEEDFDRIFCERERLLPWQPASLATGGRQLVVGNSRRDSDEALPASRFHRMHAPEPREMAGRHVATARPPEASDSAPLRPTAVAPPDPVADPRFMQSLSHVRQTLADEKALSEKFEARLQAMLLQHGLLDDGQLELP